MTMEENEPKKESRLEKLKEVREQFKGLWEHLQAERDRRKAIMLKRHALFMSMICDFGTVDDFYREYSELLGLLGIDMYFLKRKLTGESGLTISIQFDYSEYEDYIIYEENGKLKISGTVSWQNEVCANEDWYIMPDSNDAEGNDDNEEEDENYWVRDDAKNEEFGYEPYW